MFCPSALEQRALLRRLAQSATLIASVCLLTASPLRSLAANDLVYATGRVTTQDGEPLRGAIVAIYDDRNKVVDYARTDYDGNYAVAVPKSAIHLDKHSKGFFATVFGGVAHLVGGAASFIANPLKAGVDTVAGAEEGLNPNPLMKGGIAAGGAVVDTVLFPVTNHRKAPINEERKQPGVLVMKVSMPGRNDLVGMGHIYWVQQTRFNARGREDSALQAWVDPVKLTNAESDLPSSFSADYLKFKYARIEPSLAQPGDTVRITARLPSPPSPEIYAVVVARNSRTGEKWELSPVGDDRYEGSIEISRRFPANDQVISIIAYAQENQRPGRRKDAEAAIEGAGLWDPTKPYRFDPALVVSRSRADLTLTVLPGEGRGRRRRTSAGD